MPLVAVMPLVAAMLSCCTHAHEAYGLCTRRAHAIAVATLVAVHAHATWTWAMPCEYELGCTLLYVACTVVLILPSDRLLHVVRCWWSVGACFGWWCPLRIAPLASRVLLLAAEPNYKHDLRIFVTARPPQMDPPIGANTRRIRLPNSQPPTHLGLCFFSSIPGPRWVPPRPRGVAITALSRLSIRGR